MVGARVLAKAREQGVVAARQHPTSNLIMGETLR